MSADEGFKWGGGASWWVQRGGDEFVCLKKGGKLGGERPSALGDLTGRIGLACVDLEYATRGVASVEGHHARDRLSKPVRALREREHSDDLSFLLNIV